MTTPVPFSRLAPFRLAQCTLLLALAISGCQPDIASDDSGKVTDPIDTDDSGTVELALQMRTLSYTQSNPGPTQIVLNLQVPTDARVELYMNDVLQKSWNTGDACVEFPAFTLCEDDQEQSIATMIETGGATLFELTALKGDAWKTVTFERDLTLGQCISNEAFFNTEVKDVLQNQCGSCHNAGNPAFNANANWSQFASTIFNSSHRLYFAPSHQENGHGAQPLEPYDADYRAIAELVWRSLNTFQCS